MTETNHLCDLWEHTIAKVFKHDPKCELGLMLKQWTIFNSWKISTQYRVTPLMILHHLEICVT